MYYNYYFGNINRLNESSGGIDYTGNTSTILKIGTIPMYIEKLDTVMDVELKPIVQCVDRAIGKIISRYKFMAEYIRYNRTMYVLADPSSKNTIHKTMAVDTMGNLWLNVHFIYKDLNNDTNRVFGIIFHELMHNFLNHLERSKKILPADAREKLFKISPEMLKQEQLKQNICTDLEVNCNMVADGVVSKDFWEEMHGFYDEKYMGKTWEEIYKTEGDKLLSDYLASAGSGMDEKYYAALKAIVEALKVLNDPDATEEEKEKAAHKLEDTIEELIGEEKKRKKITIRKRLKKLQKTRIREIGEVGPTLKAVIDDLEIKPKMMNADNITVFKNDVESLKKAMIDSLSDIAKTFKCDDYTLEEDINDFAKSLSEGVEKINKTEDDDECDRIERDVIYTIDKLLADDIKKKELAEEKRKREEEDKKKAAEKMKEKIEEKKKKHILDKYFKTMKNLQIIHYHERASATTAELCQNVMDMVEPLLSKGIADITESDISGYKDIFGKLRDSLYSDLMVLKDAKIIIKRDEPYLKRITDEFYKFNVELFDNLLKTDMSKTVLVGIIATAIDSIRLVGKNLHTTAKYRPSDEYRKAYKEEYDKLRKIYKELGEKGLRKELGLPAK